MSIFKVHAKVDEILREFFIVNPQNLVINEGEVVGASGISGVDGKPVSASKMIINYPNGRKLIVEETIEELVELFGKD